MMIEMGRGYSENTEEGQLFWLGKVGVVKRDYER